LAIIFARARGRKAGKGEKRTGKFVTGVLKIVGRPTRNEGRSTATMNASRQLELGNNMQYHSFVVCLYTDTHHLLSIQKVNTHSQERVDRVLQ
jgi:hypothetical protein